MIGDSGIGAVGPTGEVKGLIVNVGQRKWNSRR